MTQIGVLENLKMENVSLSHQLTETKHRSIKEKERIAVQLQSIEVRRVAFTPTSQPDLIRSSAPKSLSVLNAGYIRCAFQTLPKSVPSESRIRSVPKITTSDF